MSYAIPCRVALQQRVFPAYRAAFFDALAAECAGGLSVFAGRPMPDESLGQEGELYRAQRVQAHNLYLGWGPLLTYYQVGIIDWLERWQPEVLITDTNPRSFSTREAIRWMHMRHRPVIGWGLGYPSRRAGLLAALEFSRRSFVRSFDVVISYSHTGAEQYAAAGLSRERIFIAPNAVTLRPTQPAPQRAPVFGNAGPVILFVGRLQTRKRLDMLLRACAQLTAEGQPLVLRIVGDGPARTDLETLAQTVFPAAQFLGDRRGKALDAQFAAADVFALPGTGGLAVQQAMSFALPVIVAEADGTQGDLVRPGNGWMLPAGDDDALFGALRTALSDPVRLRQMGCESYRIVQEEVNLERMVSVFAQAIGTARGR